MQNMYSWKSIPAMAVLFKITTAEMSQVLHQLGLRTKTGTEVIVEPWVFADGIAKHVTVVKRSVSAEDITNDVQTEWENIQWNYLAVKAMIEGRYPKDQSWAGLAEEQEFMDMVRGGKFPF